MSIKLWQKQRPGQMLSPGGPLSGTRLQLPDLKAGLGGQRFDPTQLRQIFWNSPQLLFLSTRGGSIPQRQLVPA